MLALALAVLFVVLLAGCEAAGAGGDSSEDDSEDPGTEAPEETAEDDTTPPAEVSRLTVAEAGETVALAWVDPADEDLGSIQITWEPGGAEAQTVDPGVGSYVASGLTNGETYTFTVIAVDKAENASGGQTIDAVPDDFSTLSGTISGTVMQETSTSDGSEPTDVNISAQSFSGQNIDIDEDPSFSATFSLELGTPSDDKLVGADGLPGTLTLGNTAAGIQVAEVYGSYEDAWAYGPDFVLFGTTNNTEWRYASYFYADQATTLSGSYTDEYGDDYTIAVLLAPGWNRVLTVLDVSARSYTVSNGDPPSDSTWLIEENQFRTAVNGGDQGVAAYDVPDTWEVADETTLYLGGVVGTDFDLQSGLDGAYDGRTAVIEINYANPSGDPPDIQNAAYELDGADGTVLESVSIYVYISDPEGSSQRVMLSKPLVGSFGLVGEKIRLTEGSFTYDDSGGSPTATWSFTTNTARNGPVEGAWPAATP